MMQRSLIILIVALLIFIPANFLFSQTDSSYIQTEEMLEDLLQEPSEETDNSDLYESLEYLLNHPINLNAASVIDLQLIPELDFKSAELIVNHRKRYGNFFTVNELNAVQGLDKDLIEKITPYFIVKKVKRTETPPEEPEPVMKEILSNSNLKLRSRYINDL